MFLLRRPRFPSWQVSRVASSSRPSVWARQRSEYATLPGGFNADGLRDWALRTNFGSNGNDASTGREWRRRRRRISDDPGHQPYVDMFAKTVTKECKAYLDVHPSPSDALGRAFFGSRRFAAERRILTSLNALLSLYPEGTTSLPAQFAQDDRYLQWRVSAKAPLELICSYEVGGAAFRGCTMLAFDPSLGKAYLGNALDVTEEKTKGVLSALGVRMHVWYAGLLLDGMVDELEKKARQRK